MINLEKLLNEGNSIQIKPQGYSMYPLFVPGRDEAIISPLGTHKLRRGDVILYRREGSILVLHRICHVKPEGVYTVGDNQTEIEGPVTSDQIKGILTTIIHNHKHVSVSNPIYKFMAGFWLMLRPLRPHIAKLAYKIKHMRQ